MFNITRERSLVLAAMFVGILVVASFWAVFIRKKSTSSDEKTFAQEYSLAFVDYDGHQVLLSSYRRHVLVAYTWASWCPYCGRELENLAQLKKSYGDEVQIVAVNRGETLPVARDYTAQLNVAGLALLLDPTDAFFKEIGGYAMPETVFIDSRGKVLFHQQGPMNIVAVQKKIDELLGR